MIWLEVWPWVLLAVLKKQRVQWWIAQQLSSRVAARNDAHLRIGLSTTFGAFPCSPRCTCPRCVDEFIGIYDRMALIR